MHRPLPADVEAVLFDLDGTLIETDNRWAAQLGKRLAPFRRVAPWWDTDRAARNAIMMIEGPSNYAVAIIERLGLSNLVSGLADRVRRSKGLATRDASELVPGSEQVLEALSQRFKLGVVTTRARREALAFLERWGFAKYFAVVVTRQDCWRMKPHPAPVLKAAATLGVPPERCIMVGDTVADVRAARRAGAYAVGVLCGFGDRRELERAQAELILERPEQLLGYL
ncbi:MAG: HAD family hydrolase [Chloroflexi bacterium]|nr:HAD family hydrolase [Chloroflexota bacterium]